MPIHIRAITPQDRAAVSELIYVSTNRWYQANRNVTAFTSADVTTVFYDVYEDLDPGCAIVAEDGGRIVGSCFYHPREHHVSLGIMNAHPDCFGQGIARKLLTWICDFADRRRQPLRLVSSAMNLDSYSLYNRAGFVPHVLYQDLLIRVPAQGFPEIPASAHVRPARLADVPQIAALELALTGLCREKDYRYFIQNARGFWSAFVYESAGEIQGFLASSAHPGCNMIGPGFARDDSAAHALILRQLNQHPTRSPILLAPALYPGLLQKMYALGARNIELHVAQSRGPANLPTGVTIPTFLPETA